MQTAFDQRQLESTIFRASANIYKICTRIIEGFTKAVKRKRHGLIITPLCYKIIKVGFMKFLDDKGKTTKIRWLLGVACIVAIGVWFFPAIPQDPGYHDFADTGKYFGIPHFWNVVSNLPFLAVGILGLLATKRGQGGLPELSANYSVFFAGVFLTGLGSGYYHWHPDNQTLVWDRVPMTLAFMALLSIIIGEHMDVRASRLLLWPLIMVGIASVGYWHWTESLGRGDLRFYGLVQFLPMLIIPLTLVSLPSRFSSVIYVWAVIVAYAVSKLLEYFDHELFRLTGFIGGHPLKHIAAALGAYALCLALGRRRLAEPVNDAVVFPNE